MTEERMRPPLDLEQELAILYKGGFDASGQESSTVPCSDEEGGRNAPVEDKRGEDLPREDLALSVITSWKSRISDGRLVAGETGSSSSPGSTPAARDTITHPRKEEDP